jgi:DNA-binding MarR family transcriptional regulator
MKSSAGVTSVIDRLERAGYTRRRHDLHDRRKVVVDSTELLIRREQEVFGELLGRLEQLAQTYSDAELSIVQDFLERSRELVVGAYQGQAPALPAQRERADEQAPIETSATPCA